MATEENKLPFERMECHPTPINAFYINGFSPQHLPQGIRLHMGYTWQIGTIRRRVSFAIPQGWEKLTFEELVQQGCFTVSEWEEGE